MTILSDFEEKYMKMITTCQLKFNKPGKYSNDSQKIIQQWKYTNMTVKINKSIIIMKRTWHQNLINIWKLWKRHQNNIKNI